MLDCLTKSLRSAPPLLHELARLPGIWLAGGWLRDACWGQASSDIDLAVEGDLHPVLEFLEQRAGRRPFRLNARFDSYGVELDGLQVDLMPLHPDGIAADVARRDYTVNTLLLPLDRLAEAVQGRADGLPDLLHADPRAWDDLAARTLRMTSRASLMDDPLRILRGYRLAAQWGLALDPQTRDCWRELAGKVLEPAPERTHDELVKLFGQPCVPQLRMMAEDGVLWRLFPGLEATVGCDQLGYHHLDVWEHTLLALELLDRIRLNLPPELEEFRGQLAAGWDEPVSGHASAGTLTRLGLLVHDIAKPPTREVRPDGRASFHGHQEVGARLMEPVLDGLRFTGDERAYVCLLIRQHMRLGYYSEPERISPKLTYRYLRHVGAATPLMILHTLADCAATQGALAEGSFERHVLAARQVLEHFYAQDDMAAPPLLLDGAEIMRLTGLPPGPRIGELKEAMLEATAIGQLSTAAEAEEFILGLQAESEHA